MVVRPRDAASLILLRGEDAALEVLVGRRPLSARFMPGVYVFPGGAIDPRDARAWPGESGAEAVPPRLLRAARAAIRETWEEVGVLLGRPAGNAALMVRPSEAPVERAYRENGVVAALDGLAYVGRAITPSHSSRRFNTRFFLADAGHAVGAPMPSPELEDAGWHRIDARLLDGFRDVTRFMLERAIALRNGAGGDPPLFYWAKNARRIGICREAS
ncbi:MAG TPA: NUDIX domain-containing protein [Stellaceae bacterium]|jgi:8-oxo-dGTP pyrophosphatase MutT (NUDIX family)